MTKIGATTVFGFDPLKAFVVVAVMVSIAANTFLVLSMPQIVTPELMAFTRILVAGSFIGDVIMAVNLAKRRLYVMAAIVITPILLSVAAMVVLAAVLYGVL